MNKVLDKKFFKRLKWMLFIGIIWELISLSGLIDPLLFPAAHTILESLIINIYSGELIINIFYSLKLILISIVIGATTAIILALLALKIRAVEELVDTIITVLHPLPGIALLPIVILWFGVDEKAIICIMVHSVLWPLLMNIQTGFKSIPKIFIDIGANYELSPFDFALHIMIPAAFPYLLVGLKIGWARAWRGLISAEMIFGAAGSIGGIGWFIFTKRVFMDTAGMYAGLLVIIVIGVLVEDYVFDLIERKTIKRWGMSI